MKTLLPCCYCPIIASHQGRGTGPAILDRLVEERSPSLSEVGLDFIHYGQTWYGFGQVLLHSEKSKNAERAKEAEITGHFTALLHLVKDY